MAVSLFGVNVADWYFFTVLAVFGVTVVVAVWWYYKSRIKIGYKAVFTVLLHGETVDVGGVIYLGMTFVYMLGTFLLS